MTFPVTEFLTRSRMTGEPVLHRPIFNAVPIATAGSRIQWQGNYRSLWERLKRSPELLATISIPITDILGDRPEWTAPDGSNLGRNKKLQAQRFWRSNAGKEVLFAFLLDAFLCGDGFMWKGKPNKRETERAVKEVVKRFKEQLLLDDLQVKELQAKAAMDEDVRAPKKIDHVASSTVQIIHDHFDIQGYEQSAAGIKVVFKPEEILHWRYMRINGEVQGFAPAEALAAEIMLLTLVKENMMSFMRNGGSPDKVFILPKELSRSKNHQYLIDTLRKYKSIANRHGNLVFTGELQIEDLQGSPKDLEYKDLALYITSNIAFSYRIPVTRIPYLIGTSSSKGDSGGLSESGYWNGISMIQDSLEDLLNSQLFEEMGWAIKFQRKYKQDEIREAQRDSMNADTIIKYQSILAKNGKQLKETKVLGLLHFNEEDIEDLDQSLLLDGNGLTNQNMLPNKSVMTETDKQTRNNAKRNSANQRGTESSVAAK